MRNSLLLGLWRLMVPLPETVWQGQVTKGAEGTVDSLAFMSTDHHRVRDFVVREIPRAGEPLSPETIARALELPLARVIDLLDELERNMTFLFRNEQGAVTWAYPVTADQTPHRIAFSTGEQGYAA
ncbi:MAG: hypothetical protein GWN58_59605 [Anaerolineae bacterium]|nr:hypothetical protein [Anaerolineae bacterium]